MSWESTESVEADELFDLTFEALQGGSLADFIELNSKITSSELYVNDTPSNIELQFDNEEIGLANAILHQNDPNPFETTTKIRFELPQASNAVVSIFDMTGKELKRFEGSFVKGLNVVELNQKDLNHSGSYYYQLVVEDIFIDSKKMIVIE